MIQQKRVRLELQGGCSDQMSPELCLQIALACTAPPNSEAPRRCFSRRSPSHGEPQDDRQDGVQSHADSLQRSSWIVHVCSRSTAPRQPQRPASRRKFPGMVAASDQCHPEKVPSASCPESLARTIAEPNSVAELALLTSNTIANTVIQLPLPYAHRDEHHRINTMAVAPRNSFSM